MFKMPSGIGRLVSSAIPERASDESTESICRKGTYQATVRIAESQLCIRMPERHLESENCRVTTLQMKLP